MNEEQQGYQEGILALAYGLPENAYIILMEQQAEDERYEFCAGMRNALEIWKLKKDQLYCTANLQDD